MHTDEFSRLTAAFKLLCRYWLEAAFYVLELLIRYMFVVKTMLLWLLFLLPFLFEKRGNLMFLV